MQPQRQDPSSTSTSTPPPPPPPTSPPAGSRPRRRSTVAALGIGLLIGGAAVGTVWALTSPWTDPASDAKGTCAALAHFDDAQFGASGKEGDVDRYRWFGAHSLAQAAAARDSAYKPLADTLNRANVRQAELGEFGGDAKKELDKARTICDGL
jgi:hypothetical protein